MIASKINFQQGGKKSFKPNEAKEGSDSKPKVGNSQNSSKKAHFNNNKNKEKKKGYKGKAKLSPEELERLRKENKCFKCGEQGHISRVCPKRGERNEPPRATIVEALKEDGHCQGAPLSYAWGKVREHDALILFDPGSTHNFISNELAARLGIQDFEMGEMIKANGAFKEQEVSVTPLIGKLRLHIQGYVDKEDFFISPLKHQDVILGAPWFDRMSATMKFPERQVHFTFREKQMLLKVDAPGSTIPLVHNSTFDKVMKSSVSCYMVFVKESSTCESNAKESEIETKEHLGMSQLLNEFQDVFTDDIPNELPPKRGQDDHYIDLIPGSSPPNKPPYRVSQAQQEEIMRQVNELMEKGMVKPSSSPFCSPVLLVQKKDGTYRMCVDYRALNRITIKNRFPVPRVEDLFDKLQGSTYFSRIDLKSGYHQIRIVHEDIPKTAFRTTFGLYEYLVMPFGLTNAPATFNRLMERLFRPHQKFTGVFFDDIIIHSKTLEEHKQHLQVILQVLRENKLYVNQKKSEFFLEEIRYLGHIISHGSIQMDYEKLEVIKDWPIPKNLHEVRSFIGMCAYYRRFIEKFSLIARPLHDLTKKHAKFIWSAKENNSFENLKAKLITKPVLVLPDFSKPFEVQCDACGECLGAVLLQEGHAIAYESRSLNEHERNLGIYEKELLAILHALDTWKHYLLGTPFILRTDHQSLKYFLTQTKMSDKQMRWANILSQFNFHIAHIAGKHNQVADALSRRPKVNAVSIATHNDLSSMIDEYATDPDFKDVMSTISLGKKDEPFNIQDGYLLYGNRLCVTRSLRNKVMFESHAPPYAGHRGIQTTLKGVEMYFYWPSMKVDIQEYVSTCTVCQKIKYDRGKQPGLLQPLPIPDSPWESISMDFIFGLPKSIHGNNGIWTIVDRFSKQAHFIPVKKTIKSHQMATLFISQIFKYHGLPTSIVSDRDPRMTSNFWKGLFDNLGTRLNFSSAYHPQTDGQSEIANLTIIDLLKAYVTEVDQRDQWEKYLPLVEYAYNNTVHTSTGKAPFEVIEGRPKLPLIVKPLGNIYAADEYSRDLKESFQKIKDAISIAQAKQKAAANKHRRPMTFKENDWVLLKFPKARLKLTTGKGKQGRPTGHQKYYAKLAKRYYGPFQVLMPINELAYKLKLPRHWLIHNAFHVSLLKPYKGEPPKEPIIEDPPEFEGQEEILQPESILKHEDKVLRNGKITRRYLVKYKNYPFEDARWMQDIQLKDNINLVQAYNDSC